MIILIIIMIIMMIKMIKMIIIMIIMIMIMIMNIYNYIIYICIRICTYSFIPSYPLYSFLPGLRGRHTEAALEDLGDQTHLVGPGSWDVAWAGGSR